MDDSYDVIVMVVEAGTEAPESAVDSELLGEPGMTYEEARSLIEQAREATRS